MQSFYFFLFFQVLPVPELSIRTPSSVFQYPVLQVYDTQPSSMPPDSYLDTRPVDHETTVPRVNFGYAGEGETLGTGALQGVRKGIGSRLPPC